MKKPKILFICYGNVCRSAMAKYIADEFYGDRAEADSCGTHSSLPFIELWQPTIEALREINIDMSDHQPKHIDKVKEKFDIVINMSPFDNEILKARNKHLKDAQWEYWSVRDPGGLPLSDQRAVRDVLIEKIKNLLFT